MSLPLPEVFADLTDPRRDTKNKRHLLVDGLALASCAFIGGAESWGAIAIFVEAQKDFFRRSVVSATC